MSKFKKCNVALSNMMAEPSHTCEMYTQLLYNDKVELLEAYSKIWIKVRSKFNQAEGFVLVGQFDDIDESKFLELPEHICLSQSSEVKMHGVTTRLIPGSYYYPDENSIQVYNGDVIALKAIGHDEDSLKRLLYAYLNAPYMWGGISNSGIDCSGFSKMFYRFLGIPLKSFAIQQFEQGRVLDFLQDAKCGDLAFFENEMGVVSHVGVLLSASEIIHATEKVGRVVIDHIDMEGIISKQTGQRTHKLRMVKRFLGEA